LAQCLGARKPSYATAVFQFFVWAAGSIRKIAWLRCVGTTPKLHSCTAQRHVGNLA